MFTSEDLTFVICAYKDNPFLEDTMITLLDQKAKCPVMLSTHTPSDYIEGLCDKWGIPMTINPAPHLAGDDWNWAYDAASTPLVTLAHQDDFYERDYAMRVLETANRYKPDEFSLIFTDYFEIRDGAIVRDNLLLNIKRVMNAPFRSDALNGSRFVKRRVLAFGDPICCPAATYNKALLGPSIFDTTYINSCDYQTFVNLAGARGRFVHIPEQLMGHRIYEESATSLNLGENIRKAEDREVMSSLWPKPVARAINAVYALSEKSNEL